MSKVSQIAKPPGIRYKKLSIRVKFTLKFPGGLVSCRLRSFPKGLYFLCLNFSLAREWFYGLLNTNDSVLNSKHSLKHGHNLHQLTGSVSRQFRTKLRRNIAVTHHLYSSHKTESNLEFPDVMTHDLKLNMFLVSVLKLYAIP